MLDRMLGMFAMGYPEPDPPQLRDRKFSSNHNTTTTVLARETKHIVGLFSQTGSPFCFRMHDVELTLPLMTFLENLVIRDGQPTCHCVWLHGICSADWVVFVFFLAGVTQLNGCKE